MSLKNELASVRAFFSERAKKDKLKLIVLLGLLCFLIFTFFYAYSKLIGNVADLCFMDEISANEAIYAKGPKKNHVIFGKGAIVWGEHTTVYRSDERGSRNYTLHNQTNSYAFLLRSGSPNKFPDEYIFFSDNLEHTILVHYTKDRITATVDGKGPGIWIERKPEDYKFEPSSVDNSTMTFIQNREIPSETIGVPNRKLSKDDVAWLEMDAHGPSSLSESPEWNEFMARAVREIMEDKN